MIQIRRTNIPNLSVVIPTYNEKENLPVICEAINKAAVSNDIPIEIIIVDDNSPDLTYKVAEDLSKKYPIKLIRRINKRGLGSAIIDGIAAASSEIVCIIDADLSHPPQTIPKMYQMIKSKEAELVVGSRLVSSGGVSDWIWYRRVIHIIARTLGSFLTPIKDVTSGYFMFDKKIIEGVKLNPTSWKIALEIIVKGKYKKAVEFPIVFKEREAGKSKITLKDSFDYLIHLISLTVHKFLFKR